MKFRRGAKYLTISLREKTLRLANISPAREFTFSEISQECLLRADFDYRFDNMAWILDYVEALRGRGGVRIPSHQFKTRFSERAGGGSQ